MAFKRDDASVDLIYQEMDNVQKGNLYNRFVNRILCFLFITSVLFIPIQDLAINKIRIIGLFAPVSLCAIWIYTEINTVYKLKRLYATIPRLSNNFSSRDWEDNFVGVYKTVFEQVSSSVVMVEPFLWLVMILFTSSLYFGISGINIK